MDPPRRAEPLRVGEGALDPGPELVLGSIRDSLLLLGVLASVIGGTVLGMALWWGYPIVGHVGSIALAALSAAALFFLLALGLARRQEGVRRLSQLAMPGLAVLLMLLALRRGGSAKLLRDLLFSGLAWAWAAWAVYWLRRPAVRALFRAPDAAQVRGAMGETIRGLGRFYRNLVGLFAFACFVGLIYRLQVAVSPGLRADLGLPEAVAGLLGLFGAVVTASLIVACPFLLDSAWRERAEEAWEPDVDLVERVEALRDEGQGLEAIAARLAEEGRAPPAGRRWRERTIRRILLSRPRGATARAAPGRPLAPLAPPAP